METNSRTVPLSLKGARLALGMAAYLALAVAEAQPVTDHGCLVRPVGDNSPYSFIVDAVGDFTGASDGVSQDLDIVTAEPSWGHFASGNLQMNLLGSSRDHFDLGAFGEFDAVVQNYRAVTDLIYGYDEVYNLNGLNDVYQIRNHVGYEFDIEIRWYTTTRGIEPKLTITDSTLTTAYACQKLIELQGGCASRSPGTISYNPTVDLLFCLAAGDGEWTVDIATGPAEYRMNLVGGPLDVPRGNLRVQLRNLQPADLKDTIDQATVSLIRQSDFIRPQGPGESAADYQAFLDTLDQAPVQVRHVTHHNGDPIGFAGLPLFERVGDGALVPSYYSYSVSAARTEELDINQNPVDPNITATTFFFPQVVPNRFPSLNPNPLPTQVNLRPADVLLAKQALIDQVRLICEEDYRDAENQMEDALIGYLANPAAMSGANIEGVKRVVWAERLFRDVGTTSFEAIDLALTGLANILSEIFSKKYDFKRGDIKQRQADIKRQNAAAGQSQGAFMDLRGANTGAAVSNMSVDVALIEGNIASIASSIVKLSTPYFVQRCTDVGNDPQACKDTAKNFELAAASIADAFSSRSARGSAKSLLKALIKSIVKEKGGEFIKGAYCSRSAPLLATAVSDAVNWKDEIQSKYQTHINEVVQILRQLTDDHSLFVANAIQAAESRQALDRTQTLASIFAKVVKPIKVIEEVLRFSKYAADVATLAGPLIYTVKADSALQRGALRAFGKPIPARKSSPRHTKGATYSRNGIVLQDLASSVLAVSSASFSLRQAMAADDFVAVVAAVADPANPDNYMVKLDLMTRRIERFKALLASALPGHTAADQINEFITADLSLKKLNTELIIALRSLLVDLDTGLHASTDDPGYAGKRDALIDLLLKIQLAAIYLNQAADDADRFLAGAEALPALWVYIDGFISEQTQSDVVSQTPETFELAISVENLGSVAVDGHELTLLVDGDTGVIALLDPAMALLPSLPAGASTQLSWRLTYSGALEDELVGFRLRSTQGGAEPIAFVATQPHLDLIVDPTVTDLDEDGLPDYWENRFGLNPGIDDAGEDPDNDNLSHLQEFDAGTNPVVADSDGDGLNDGDELSAASNGYVTDPLDPDTDADLTNDGLDGAPLDGASQAVGPMPDEPEVMADMTSVLLSHTQRSVSVSISNSGTGMLGWSAVTDAPELIQVSPTAPGYVSGDGALNIAVSTDFEFDQESILPVTVTVFDVAGAQVDAVSISVNFLPERVFANGFE